MTASEVLKIFKISGVTLGKWEAEGLISSQKDRYGYRVFDAEEVMFVKTFIKHDGKTGHKLDKIGLSVALTEKARDA